MSCVPIHILVYVFVYAYVMCTYPYFSLFICVPVNMLAEDGLVYVYVICTY